MANAARYPASHSLCSPLWTYHPAFVATLPQSFQRRQKQSTAGLFSDKAIAFSVPALFSSCELNLLNFQQQRMAMKFTTKCRLLFLGIVIQNFLQVLVTNWNYTSPTVIFLQDEHFDDQLTTKNIQVSMLPQPQNKKRLQEIEQEQQSILLDQNWLKANVRLGKFLGQGIASVAFEAKIKQGALQDIMIGHRPREYVIKFTGDHNRRGEYEPDFFKHSQVAYDVTKKLSPHPSIPQTIYFQPSVVNPFHPSPDGIFSNFSTSNLSETVEISESLIKRLLMSSNTSIALMEKAVATHRHLRKPQSSLLVLPTPDLVKCFWYQLFQILDHVHSHQIQWVDTKLWNVLLQNGRIILFDWHKARTVHRPTNTQAELPFGHVILEDPKEKVSDYDVFKVGKRIKEYLKSKKAKAKPTMKSAAYGNNANTNATHYGINEDAIGLYQLHTLREMMHQPYPPTMGWFLKNHEYFNGTSPSCKLIW